MLKTLCGPIITTHLPVSVSDQVLRYLITHIIIIQVSLTALEAYQFQLQQVQAMGGHIILVCLFCILIMAASELICRQC